MPLRPTPRSRWFGRVAALAACSVLVPNAVHADSDAEAAERAAREIQAARDRANEAAQQLFDAESRIDVLDAEIASAERRLAEMEDDVDVMRDSLSEVAIRRFVAGGTETNPLLGPVDDLNAADMAGVYAGAASGDAIVAVDEFDQAITDLDAARGDLERKLAAATAARDDFEQLQEQAEAEIVRLTEIEEQRLRDVEVRKALERQRAEQLAQERAAADAAAAEAAAAEAEQQAAATARERAEQRAATPTAAPEVDTGAADAPSSGDAGGADPAPSDDAQADAGQTTTTAAPTTAAPATTAPPTPAAPSGPRIACPVGGPAGFADTWGAPRSGGRSHQGVDMIAAHGTPLVAAEAGYANFKTTRLGGNSVSLQGGDGTRYFYAHLSSWAGSSRNVAKGEVIGYVGATGNTSVNHLHFEIHPGGGSAVNPYPAVRAAC